MASNPPVRPERFTKEVVPAIPDVSGVPAEEASTEYSHYRTGLSRHRTGLSEHRTDLSEFRTDLSTGRTEMSSRRTGMSIHRTRMSADRTLMAEIRTSLSLIGFGFTINQAFRKLYEAGTIHNDAAPRNFGISLLVLGILLLVGGIWRHLQFATELRRNRGNLVEQHLVHGESKYPVSITLIAAIALLAIGILAVVSTISDIRAFG